jgi:hypothetical protein
MSKTIRCPSCGYQNDPADVVCMGCGWPIGDDPGADPDPDWIDLRTRRPRRGSGGGP